MGKKKCCTLNCGLVAAGIVGAILVIIGGIAVAVFDSIFRSILIQEGTIKEGTIMYDQWVAVTTPTYISYYFYNVTNPEEFLAQTSDKYVPPILQELGPYTFREYLAKDRINFLPDLDPEEVYFRQKYTYYFERERSSGSLDDNITTLNIIAAKSLSEDDDSTPHLPLAVYLICVSALSVARIIEYQLDGAVIPGLWPAIRQLYRRTQTELLFTKTAHDLLFGFQDDLYDSIADIASAANVTIPPTFGLFSTANVSAGWFDYQVYTGKKHPELINVITHYKNQSKLDSWGTEECNMINGTDGTTTPPFMKQEDRVYFFIDDVCRSLYSVFTEEVVLKRVPAWKYSIPAEIFQSPVTNPDNECFCPHPDEPLCKHDGAILLESCQSGAPILISSPHFLNGDGYWFSQTSGLSPPNPEDHEAAIVYEPNTGTAIRADKRLQINILLTRNSEIPILDIIQNATAFPVVWLNESAILGDSDADLLYGLLVVPAEVVSVLQIVFCIVGTVLLIAPVVYGLTLTSGKVSASKSQTNYKLNGSRPPIMSFNSDTSDVFSGKELNQSAHQYDNTGAFVSNSSTSEILNKEEKF